MSTSSLPRPVRVPRRALAERARAVGRVRPELLGLLVLAAVLNLWALDTNAFANDYYSAAVRSMSQSWHAFLYGSFDSSGVMTVDKPPLALWVQALSVRAFGFNSWAILVPQALMGVATVGLAYDLVRRPFGRAAGTAAGLTLALTPIAVAISRHNNPDALLVLCSTLAVWALVRALQDGRTRWLVLCGVAVGLGFEAKMAAALLVVPGIAAAYLWMAPRGRLVAVGQLLAGGGAMVAIGLAWPVLVWLTPAADRPWVSGTADNSVWSLIFGYNGLGRVFGQDGGPGGGTGGPGGGGGGGMGGVFGGDTGALRLLNQALGGQAGWFLGFALVSAVALLAVSRLRRADLRTGFLIAVGGAWLVTAVTFSRAEGIFHPYYVSALAPFTAALVGGGVGVLLKGGLPARILAPAAVAAGIACEVVILNDNPGELGWTIPVMIVVAGAGAVAIAMGAGAKLRAAAVAAVLGMLLLAPATWAAQTLGHPTSGTFPAGGPESASTMGGPGGGGGRGGFGGGGGGFTPPTGAQNGQGFTPPGGATGGQGFTPPGGTTGQGAAQGGPGGAGGMFGGNSELTAAVAYAKANGGGTIAVSSQSGAAGSVIQSGADVAAIGGFSGRESQVSVAWLADRVASGEIRWVLTDGTGGGMGIDDRIGASQVMEVVAQVGKPVASVDGMYDLHGLASALRAAA